MRKAWRTSVCGWLAAAAVTALPLSAIAAADPPPQVPAQAAPEAPPVATTGKILILPFTAVNPNDARPWIGRSIQDSLIADLSVSAPSRVITSNEVANSDEQAIGLGRRLGARYVVMGSFASADPDLRITGKVIDVESGQPIGGLKVTGAPDQIFHLEDGIAMQVKSRLMPDVLAAQQRMAGQNAPSTQPAEGQYTGVQTAPLSSYYSNYAYPTPSPYYDQYYYTAPAYYYGGPGYVDYPLWSYPYYFSPFFSVGFSFHDGFHHHDFDHGHFDRGHFDGGHHFDGRTGISGRGTFAGSGFSGRTFSGSGFVRSSGGFSGGHSFGGGMHGGMSAGAHGGGGGHR